MTRLKAAYKASTKDGKLVKKIDSEFPTGTDFSAIKQGEFILKKGGLQQFAFSFGESRLPGGSLHLVKRRRSVPSLFPVASKSTPFNEASRRDFSKPVLGRRAGAASLNFISRSSATRKTATRSAWDWSAVAVAALVLLTVLSADNNVKLTAVADVFPDKVDRAVNILKKQHEKKGTPPSCWSGFYQS